MEIGLRAGRNNYDLMARNADGYSRIVNLEVLLIDRDPEGQRIVVKKGTPSMSVDLPPDGTKLNEPKLHVAGSTDPGNTVRVNDHPVEIRSDGTFVVDAELPVGRSRLVIEEEDPEGATGAIEREFVVARHNLFLLAFADGKIGKTKGEGFIEGGGGQVAESGQAPVERYHLGDSAYIIAHSGWLCQIRPVESLTLLRRRAMIIMSICSLLVKELC